MAANVKVTIKDDNLRKLIAAASGRIRDRLIADGVEYGIFQELTASGHPSLVPAFEDVTRGLPKAMGQAIEKFVSLDEIIEKGAFDIQTLWADDVNVDTGAYKNSIHVEEQ